MRRLWKRSRGRETMTQLSLLDRPAPSRPLHALADPPTSRLAAKALVASGAWGKQAQAVLDLVREHPGLTAGELALASGGRFDRYQVARRLSDLLAKGEVEQVGTRACTISGKVCVTWITWK